MIRTILSVSLAWMLLALPGSASGQERFVTSVSYGTLRAMFTQPVIATDGQTFLTAWIEMGGPGPRVVVQRLDQASPTTVPKTIYADFGVAHGGVNLAWTGSDYLMIHTAGGAARPHLRSVRLDRAGDPIAGTSRVLEGGIRGGALTSRGSESLIMGRTDSESVSLVLNANDQVVRREIVATHPFMIADVAATETGFVAVLSSFTGLAFVRLDPKGNRLDPEPIRIMTSDGTIPDPYGPLQVRLVEADGRTLVVWIAGRSQGVSNLFSAIIGPTGEASPAVVLPHQVPVIGSLDVAREASGYQLLLTGGTLNSTGSIVDSDLETLRLDDSGHALSAPRRFGPTPLLETGARLARNQHGYGVIWRTDLNPQWSESRIAGFTGPSLELDPPSLPLSRTVTSQIQADVAGDGLGYLVAWLEEDLDRQKIVAARLDAQGNAVGDPLVLFERHFSFTSPPKVVYAHGMYLVTWNVERSLWGVRVDAEGRRLDPQPVLISGPSKAMPEFDVTSSPAGFFAVWKPERNDIIGAELTLAGATTPQPVTVPIEIPAGYISDQSAPEVAFNGEIYLVSYTHSESPPCFQCDITEKNLMARLDRTGRPIGQPVQVEGRIQDIVSGGGNFALLQFGMVRVIEPRNLSTLGSILYPSDWWGNAALIGEGSSFRLMWSEDSTVRRTGIYHRRIHSDGTAGDAKLIGRFGSGPLFDFRAAATLTGELLTIYSRRPPEAPFNGALRVVVQRLDETSEPPALPRRRAARR